MDRLTRARQNLIERIWEKLGIQNEPLRQILLKVPRHAFVDSAFSMQAYQDNSLPISHGQTISQPTMVALMTHHLCPGANDKILEIGTGSGYQAAVLAEYTSRLFTIERHPELTLRARKTLTGLGYHNIVFRTGDGSRGWAGQAPFDRIIVTAGAPVVPDSLKKQLADGGRLLIPTGDRETQNLTLVERVGDTYRESDLGGCRFVPLVGEGGWS